MHKDGSRRMAFDFGLSYDTVLHEVDVRPVRLWQDWWPVYC
jgi:hypothetical protein